MATGDVALGNAGVEAAHPAPGAKQDKSGTSQKPVINDFNIQVAAVNGSGSQSANSVLLRSIFGMGSTSQRQKSFPFEHCRAAYLVYDPRQQIRLRRAQKGDRHPGRDER